MVNYVGCLYAFGLCTYWYGSFFRLFVLPSSFHRDFSPSVFLYSVFSPIFLDYFSFPFLPMFTCPCCVENWCYIMMISSIRVSWTRTEIKANQAITEDGSVLATDPITISVPHPPFPIDIQLPINIQFP